MRKTLWGLLGLLLVPGLAAADCGGHDLMADLARSDPAAHAALLARAQTQPNAVGKFWRVSKPGVAPSYLYGTYHDTEVAGLPLDPAVIDALDKARLMQVELTLAEQARLEARVAQDPSFIFATDDAGLVSRLLARLEPSQRAEAEAVLAKRGLDLATADRLRPWMLYSILGLPACQLEAIGKGAPVLDTMLMRRATAKGVPLQGLETYEAALGAFDALPRELAPDLLGETLRGVAGEEDTRATLLALYQAGQTAAIGEVSLWAGQGVRPDPAREAEMRRLSAVFSDVLIHRRNRAWLPALSAEMAKGGVFAAFGALHLPGSEGVVALLQGQGFTLTRLD